MSSTSLQSILKHNNASMATEESSHLLEKADTGKHVLQPAAQDNLIDNMAQPAQKTQSESKTRPQYFAALAAAGGAFAAGTILGWSAPAQLPLTSGDYGYPISEVAFSWIGSAMTLGATCVCVPTGFLINIIGRKLTMLWLVLPFTLGWCLLIWAQNVAMMYVARFILGMSGGAFCVTVPMYTGEIAHKDIRGTLGSFFQLMITLGILFVYSVGAGLSVFWLNMVCGTIPLIFGAIFFFMPESPLYWVKKNEIEKAVKSIQWLRGQKYDYKMEMDELQDTEKKIKENRVSIGKALARPINIKALVISLGLMVFQQLSGINAYIFYQTNIFKDADTGIDEKLSTILVGIVQVIATFVSVMVVDKLGRRMLLLASSSVMALSNIAMGGYFYMKENDKDSVTSIGWLPVCSLCIFIIMFSIGFGPVPWLMMGELFASDIKGEAGSIAGTTNWFLAFLVTKTFVHLKDALGSGFTFWLFACISLLGAVFVLFIVPETKGKSLNEIQVILGQKANKPLQSDRENKP